MFSVSKKTSALGFYFSKQHCKNILCVCLPHFTQLLRIIKGLILLTFNKDNQADFQIVKY